MKITLTDYAPDWPQRFEAEKTLLRQHISQPAVIEHIGSTAIPGLCAKPIIDILIGVASLARINEAVPQIEALGYEYISAYEDQMPYRRFFRKWNNGIRTHHIHMVEEKSTFWNRHLSFRDYLRAHHDIAAQYGELKRALAEKEWDDMNDYADAKTAFIRDVEKRAAAKLPVFP